MTLEDLPVILYGPNESKPEEKPKIYVIHENDRWMQPLREALEEQSLEYVELNTGLGGIVDLPRPPPLGVFYNRSSASSHTRNHRFANEYAHAILEWLELYGRRVVNGSRALQLEISKIRQYAALERCGIRTPKTVAVTGDYKNFKTEYIQNLSISPKQNFLISFQKEIKPSFQNTTDQEEELEFGYGKKCAILKNIWTPSLKMSCQWMVSLSFSNISDLPNLTSFDANSSIPNLFMHFAPPQAKDLNFVLQITALRSITSK